MRNKPQGPLNGKKTPRVWLEVALVHLLPVGITGALGGVYIAGLGWNASANEITLLLVAGKVYEYLILASLSSFMLHRIRATLCSSRGVPLGFLTAPFRVNATVVLYLIGRQFSTGSWSMARGKGGGAGDFTTKMLIIAVSSLAIAAAPSSSILMLPKLDWWPIATPTAASVLTSPVVKSTTTPISSRSAFEPPPLDSGTILFNATLSQLYPLTLDSSTVRPFCDLKDNHDQERQGPLSALGRQSLECPYAGLSGILSELPQILALDHIPEYVSNLSMSGRDYTRHISLGWQFSQSDSGGDMMDVDAVTYATTPPDFISRQLHVRGGNAFWQQSRSELKTVAGAVEYRLILEYSTSSFQWADKFETQYRRWHQPVVATECAPLVAVVIKDETVVPDRHMYSASFTVGPHAPIRITMPDLRSFIGHSAPQSSSNVLEPGLTYINLTQVTADANGLHDNISAAFISLSSNSTDLCLVTAKWVQSDVWLAQPLDNAAQSSVSVDPSSAVRKTFHNSSEVLVVSDDWLRILDMGSRSYNRSTANSSFAELDAACKGKTRIARCHSIALSLYMADALARVQYHRHAYGCEGWLPSLARPIRCQRIWSNDGDELKSILLQMSGMKRFIGVSSTYYRMQYGYGIKGFTVSLAWITVMLHAVLVMVHIIQHVIRKKTYQETGWSDIGELVACALKTEETSSSVCMDPRAKGDKTLWRLRTNINASKVDPME
ncbi:hypothetical protein HD806DRAFT_543653 [Xylariaceae sp. AK1471]|nr:hypothetical protein HD806DRAFT_543653 [Xylariaceae sp. AK1471]